VWCVQPLASEEPRGLDVRRRAAGREADLFRPRLDVASAIDELATAAPLT
jgi:hypothetical protein